MALLLPLLAPSLAQQLALLLLAPPLFLAALAPSLALHLVAPPPLVLAPPLAPSLSLHMVRRGTDDLRPLHRQTQQVAQAQAVPREQRQEMANGSQVGEVCHGPRPATVP